MIEIIKNKIWNLLEEKEVSLAMIFDKSGKIAWSKGRQITGRTIQEGEGFSKTYIKKSLKKNEPVKVGTVMLSPGNRVSSTSMTVLRIRSLLILPIEDPFFLYIDSGTKDAFSQLDFENIKTLGKLLGDTINLIKKNREETGRLTGNS